MLWRQEDDMKIDGLEIADLVFTFLMAVIFGLIIGACVARGYVVDTVLVCLLAVWFSCHNRHYNG